MVLLSATRLLQRAASTPTQKEELSALTQEAQALDRVLRSCLKDSSLLLADATAKVKIFYNSGLYIIFCVGVTSS